VTATEQATDTGVYVYGVVVEQDVPCEALAGIVGVDGASQVGLVGDGALAAIVSRVPLEEFGDEAVERNLRDAEWLEAKVRAHQAVLESVLRDASIVPFRFGTIYRNDEQVRVMLRGHLDLPDALARIAGRLELGVKAYLDPERFRAAEPTAPEESGRAYMLRRQAERRLDEERELFRTQCAHESHERLSAAAEDARANALRHPNQPGEPGEMLLNGAYLVREEALHAFEQAIAELEQRFGDRGVSYAVTGPWPPYNFVESVTA
jgi:hypothetical protein